jgi:regulator of protease activity HflC (stomatin/prohibitin superfamily)
VNALGDLLQRLLNNISKLIPFVVIAPWESGVMLRLGKVRKAVHGGFHWLIPFVDVVHTMETNTEVMLTSAQTVDKQTFRWACAVQIVDPVAYYTHLNDDLTLVVAAALSAAAGAILANGSIGDPAVFTRRVKKLARRRMKGWGIAIHWIELRDYTEAPVLRLMGEN